MSCPTQTYSDIFLSIDAAEDRLFRGIDERYIKAILGIAGPSPDDPGKLEHARGYFERLSSHDQIVLNAFSG